MHKFYEATDVVEAQIVKDLLERHRIEAVVLGSYLSGAAGELPVNIFPAVWLVDERDLESARELLRRYQDSIGDTEPTDHWVCSKCGERVEGHFELCWNCGASRDA